MLENICTSRGFGGVHLVDSIAYAPKLAENSVRDRARNRLMSHVIGPSIFLRSALPKPIKLLGRKTAKAAGLFG